MTLRAVSPAEAADVMNLYAFVAPAKPLFVRAAIVQFARSESIAFRDDGGTLAAALLYPLDPERPGERLAELAFICLPDLSRHMLAFIRLAHLTRDRLANDGLLRVRAHVRTGHRPGRRMALMLGMRLVGTVGDFERYEFEGSPHECIRPGRQDAVHGAGHIRPGRPDQAAERAGTDLARSPTAD
ncbi:hypothetical protein ACVWW6_005533 [Bradyrhizobium sp. USDA 3311]